MSRLANMIMSEARLYAAKAAYEITYADWLAFRHGDCTSDPAAAWRRAGTYYRAALDLHDDAQAALRPATDDESASQLRAALDTNNGGPAR